ncbi:MAG TPA: hypothetical protein VNH18_08965, partial [Bryobacteraceae bacterium]|nr:hypothetical protein [Bryobacteraceae bacterium]
KFFIPGLRRAGDFYGAAVLGTQGRVLIGNAPASFPADWVRETAALSGFTGDVRSGKLSDAELLSWVQHADTGARKSVR